MVREKTQRYKRKAFSEIAKYLKIKQIVAVIGLRRVGKTVLMKQIINEILYNTEPKNILFFSFEEKWGKVEVLENIVYYFLENIAKTKRKYIFLDEIQKVDGWEDVLKRFYDRHDDIKFIISGSASIHISKSVESLAGRIFDIYVTPLSFEEFLEMNDTKTEFQKTKTFDYKIFAQVYNASLYQKEKITSMFSEYLFKGGSPEIARESDEEIIRKYVTNSVIDRILLKDLPEEFEIKKSSALRELLEYAARETSGLFVIDRLSSLLNLNKETASNYIEYLKRAFLIHISYNYTRSIVRQIRTSKKIHIVLPSVAVALESYSRDVLLYPEIIGKYVESLAAVFLMYKHRKVFFWRTPQKEEVDIVVKEKEAMPIEVKYKTQITDADLKSVLKFMKKFKVKKGIIMTKDLLDKRNTDGKEILFVPAWLFLLSV